MLFVVLVFASHPINYLYKCAYQLIGFSLNTSNFLNYRFPVIGEKNNCSWNWKEITVEEANSLTTEDLRNQNFLISPWVVDLGAFRFFQHQVTENIIVYIRDLGLVRPTSHETFLHTILQKRNF